MEFLIIAVVLLAMLCLFLMMRFFMLKHQIKKISHYLENESYFFQNVRIDMYDRDIVRLANAIDDFIEAQRKNSNRLSEERKELSVIISGISHDFRTPLTLTLGYLQFIEKDNNLDENNLGYLKKAIVKNIYLKKLSDDFFELSKLDSKFDEIEKEDIDLSTFVSEQLFKQYKWIYDLNFKTNFSIEEDIIIQSNQHCLDRIMTNLLSNIKKYAIDMIGIKLVKNENEVTLDIFNNSEIDSDFNTLKIFDPFYRATSRTEEGTGLGLYVVKRLCLDLGYKIKGYIKEDIFGIIITIPTVTPNDLKCYTERAVDKHSKNW